MALSLQNLFQKYAKCSFDAHQLTNGGPNLIELEKRLAKLHEVEECLCFCNIFTGLYAAFHHAALPEKNHILLPAASRMPLADIAVWAGLQPRFYDFEKNSLAGSVRTIEAALTPQTALIVASRPNFADFNPAEIAAYCKKIGIPLVLESGSGPLLKAQLEGECCGLFEAFTIPMEGGEAGYIISNEKPLVNMLAHVRGFGFAGRDHVEYLGLNAKLNELHAALALAHIDMLETIRKKYADIHMKLSHELKDLKGIELIPYTQMRDFREIVLKIDDNWPLSSEETLEVLRKGNIPAIPYNSPRMELAIKNPDQCHNARVETAKYVIIPLVDAPIPENIRDLLQTAANMSE